MDIYVEFDGYRAKSWIKNKNFVALWRIELMGESGKIIWANGKLLKSTGFIYKVWWDFFKWCYWDDW